MSKTDSIWLTVLAAASICGCSTRETLGADEVLNHGNCQTLESGMSRVSYEDVARIRGSRLIDMTLLEPPAVEPPALEPPTPGPENKPDLLLLAISRGEQPTPGYGLSLEYAYLERETAVIEFFWLEPEADATLPQVITHPCIVIGLEAGPFRGVRAIDQAGRLLGELSL